MKAQPLASPLNNRIRSFLSPYSKFGTRSLSTTESRPTLDSSIVQNQKSYIDFRRVNRDGDMKPNIRIKLEDFTKKDCKKDQKLYKCTINKNKQNGKRWSKYEQNGDLITMVRELKQKLLDLQIENNMQTFQYRSLKQKQEQDAAKIFKQNDIIRNLQEAISLKRMRASHSLTICQKQSKNYDITRYCVEQNDKNKEKNRGQCRWYLDRQNLKSHESQIENSEKEDKISRQKDENISKFKLKDLQQALLEIEISKRKQLNEIDQLLFQWGL